MYCNVICNMLGKNRVVCLGEDIGLTQVATGALEKSGG